MSSTSGVIMIIWYCSAFLQCLILWLFWRGAKSVLQGNNFDSLDNTFAHINKEDLPIVGMIIPAAGNNPLMPKALRSLLTQDYPNITPIIVTGTEEDPATELAKELQAEFPSLQTLVAGDAQLCGQKNHNSLAAIAQLGNSVDIFVFCDSTHTAKNDFVRELVAPIIRGETGFTTGYHQVVAKDDNTVTLAYVVSVLFMRILQAVSVFTQPWGGAMAISYRVFTEHSIADFWKNNVVDDCSLASMLMQRRLPVKLCPKALLSTEASEHRFCVWQAWMQRQVLFLKFCVIGQWYLLGIFALLLNLPIIVSLGILALGLINAPIYPFYILAAIAHLSVLLCIILLWRKVLPWPIKTLSWIRSFALGMAMFLKVFIMTIPSWQIDWHGNRYTVSKGGIVRHMHSIK